MPDVVHAKGINDDVYATFKAIVMSKHGKINGVLGDEITEALQEYIEKNREGLVNSVQTATKRELPERKVIDKKPDEEPPSYFGSNFGGYDSVGGFQMEGTTMGDPNLVRMHEIENQMSDRLCGVPEDLPPQNQSQKQEQRVEFDYKRGLPLTSRKKPKAEPNRSPTMKNVDMVIDQLKENGVWNDCEKFPKPVVQRFIREMIGGDSRSVKKYTALIEHQWVLCEEEV